MDVYILYYNGCSFQEESCSTDLVQEKMEISQNPLAKFPCPLGGINICLWDNFLKLVV